MSINMELMREKLSTLRGENENNKSDVFWRPPEGESIIRIVPTDDGDPFKEVHFHYNVPNHKGGIMCPKRNFGDRCPICDFASSVWREGVDNNDEESKKLAKSLFVRARYFSPVISRDDEDAGVKVYGYGKKAYELLLGYVLDPEYGDITDADEGTDIAVTYTKPTRPGAYPQTSMKMRRSTSPLLEDQERIPALLDSVPDIMALFKRSTPEEIDQILDEYLSGDASAEQRSSETHKYEKETNSVDAAFDELLAG